SGTTVDPTSHHLAMCQVPALGIIKIMMELKQGAIDAHPLKFYRYHNRCTRKNLFIVIDMLVKNNRSQLVFYHHFLSKSTFQKKGHTGMAHKINIGRIGQMPIGIHIAPPNFELFYEHVFKFKY